MGKLEAPVLLVRPGFEGVYHDPENRYLKAYSTDSWGDLLAEGGPLTTLEIPNSRIIMWIDQRESVVAEVGSWLTTIRGRSH